jgi:hypothetical protein
VGVGASEAKGSLPPALTLTQHLALDTYTTPLAALCLAPPAARLYPGLEVRLVIVIITTDVHHHHHDHPVRIIIHKNLYRRLPRKIPMIQRYDDLTPSCLVSPLVADAVDAGDGGGRAHALPAADHAQRAPRAQRARHALRAQTQVQTHTRWRIGLLDLGSAAGLGGVYVPSLCLPCPSRPVCRCAEAGLRDDVRLG